MSLTRNDVAHSLCKLKVRFELVNGWATRSKNKPIMDAIEWNVGGTLGDLVIVP